MPCVVNVVMLIWNLPVSLHAFGVYGSIKVMDIKPVVNWIKGTHTLGALLMSCVLSVVMLFLSFAYITACIWSPWDHKEKMWSLWWIEQKENMIHSSSYKWCTIFLFSMLYKIPFFCVVQNSCFLWCTIFLKNGMMYLIPVWHVVPSSVVGKSFF